jgi:hypothetical protein
VSSRGRVLERGGMRRRRRRRGVAWVLALVLAALLFAAGVAVGEALHDNPRPGVTTTNVTTIAP